jgi:hypothetical protein
MLITTVAPSDKYRTPKLKNLIAPVLQRTSIVALKAEKLYYRRCRADVVIQVSSTCVIKR